MCRSCGLPVASPSDPLRGVTPGRLDVPGVRNSGVSATVGLVVVIAVLLGAGTLALSGDGILSRGGLLGGGVPSETLAPGQTAAAGSTLAPGSTPAAPAEGDGTAFSCSPISIRDPERGRWRFTGLEASPGEGFEQVVISLRRDKGRAREPGTVRTEWLSPDDAVQRFQIPLPAGDRTLVLTFDAPVALDSDRSLDAGALEGGGVENLRSIRVANGPDDKVVAIIGVAGEGCARLSSPRWARRGADRTADVLLDVELP